MKRFLTLLAFVALTITANAVIQSGSCGKNGDNVTFVLNDDGTLVISGSGDMKNYTSSAPWYRNRSNITKVQIEDGVTSIGYYAFSGCYGLTSITIPNSVTSIGDDAFGGCSGLTSITIPNSVTSIGEWAFYECSGLPSVTIGNSVTSIGVYAFCGCSGLTSVTIPNSVTSIGHEAFSGCSDLTSVNISCKDEEDFCNYLQRTDIKDVFYYGVSFHEHSIFINGEEQTSIVIPNSVTSIGDYAFAGCSGLISVTIGNSVTSIAVSAFDGCSGLTSLVVEDNNPNYSSLDDVLFNKNKTELIFCPRGKQGGYTIPNSVMSIGGYAFAGCSGLISVTIGNSVTSIGDTAFFGCSGLTSVTIGNSVTNIGNYAFAYCSGLTSITIPNSVKSIGIYAFCDCSLLTSVTIPNSVTSIGYYAFYGCSNVKELIYEEGTKTVLETSLTSITSVSIPNSVTSIGGGAFFTCSGLTSITIPNSVTSIGGMAFEGCSSLTSIEIPNSVTSIGSEAFSRCSGLTSVTIGNSVTSIGSAAFSNCSKIKEIHCQAIVPPRASTSTFKGVSKDDCNLYVPNRTKMYYASAEGWYDFINIIEEGGSDEEDVDALKAQISALESEIATLKETIKKYAEGDLNLDGRTDIDDVVYLLKLDSYSSDTDALALLLDGSTAITLSEITDKYGDVEFYTLNGVKVDVPNKSGIYIVKKNGETKMVVIKK